MTDLATVIRTYHGRTQQDAANLYATDAATLSPLGYSPLAQSWAEGRSGCLRMILLGFVLAFFMRPAGTLTVTYTGPDGVALPAQPTPTTSSHPAQRTLIGLVIAVIALAALGSVASKKDTAGATPSVAQPTGQATAGSTAAAAVTPTPAPAKPVVIKGSGTQKTKPFDLAGGDYTVTITGNCQSNVIAHLYLRGGSAYDSLFNEIAAGTYTYTTQEYGLAGGQYYLDVTDDNAWTVTLTPLT